MLALLLSQLVHDRQAAGGSGTGGAVIVLQLKLLLQVDRALL